jgi:hypothetical protein
MSKAKLNSIIEKHVEASTKHWAGKPKFSLAELSAVERFAKEKGKVLKGFFSSESNVSKLDDMFQSALKK